jgi:alkylated DNA repair dioxygenase AlkB
LHIQIKATLKAFSNHSTLDLFTQQHKPETNLLPYDGEVYCYGPIFSNEKAIQYLEALRREINWQNDVVKMYGKTIECKRQTAWMGEEHFEYAYSGTTKKAEIFTPTILEIKQEIEILCNEKFNSCLLNYYKDGNEGMSWHSDNEKTMGMEPVIASLSLGAARNFSFKHNESKEKIDLLLQNGSLIIMRGLTQKHWKHALPQSSKIKLPRINLSFRNFVHL